MSCFFFHTFQENQVQNNQSEPLIALLLGSDGPCFHQCHGHGDHDLHM